MKKKKRLIIRTSILIILLFMVIFALYLNITADTRRDIKINETAPNFRLNTLSDNQVELSNLKGKVVLVNFWATWCKPCKDEMPAIEKTYQKYQTAGFEVVAINMGESKFAVESFVNKLDINFPVLLDNNKDVTRLYDVYRLPASFLIDREGKVIEIHEGELSIETLNNWVTGAL